MHKVLGSHPIQHLAHSSANSLAYPWRVVSFHTTFVKVVFKPMSSSPDLASQGACITVSIVSHGHGQQVQALVKQVLADPMVARLVLTLNIAETLGLPDDDRLLLIQNTTAKGFGANHNSAYQHCETAYYCVLNPDIVLYEDTFSVLLSTLVQEKAGVAGPLVLSPSGQQEDSWRRFPTLWTLFLKAIGRDATIMGRVGAESTVYPGWVAGMCMLFDAQHYRAVGGFDERFFLYYEDVDICARLQQKNLLVVASPKARLIHAAQRASRLQWQHMKWHAKSMATYLLRYSFRNPGTKK